MGLVVAVNEPHAASQVELTAVTSLSPFALSYQTIPLLTYSTSDAKEKPQDCRQPTQPTQGM